MRMKRKVVQKLMCAMLASSMLMTGFGVEAFASEDKNQQELSTEAPVTDEKVTYTIGISWLFGSVKAFPVHP